MACLVTEHHYPNLSSPLCFDSSPAVMPDYSTLLRSSSQAPSPHTQRSIRHRSGAYQPSLSSPKTSTASRHIVVGHHRSSPRPSRRPTRRRSWTLKCPRVSNSVLSIKCLSLYSNSRPFSSILDRLFAFWPTSTLVISCHPGRQRRHNRHRQAPNYSCPRTFDFVFLPSCHEHAADGEVIVNPGSFRSNLPPSE
jgi:hypothetical protein